MQQQNSTNAAGPMGGPAAAGLPHKPVQGGRFDFDDGGMYCGGWEDGKAHGHGVCTGLKGQGEYCGSWNYGFEVSGVYTWPGGSTYEGHWQNGKRHGLGVETRGRWIYRGEWTQGFKGRYGVRQSLTSTAKYDGTWANGLQDGYGSESYADGGTYQGQWLRGLRHGYGVRTSAPFGMASRFRPKTNIRSSMTSLRSESHAGGGGGAGADPAADRDRRLDDGRGGFVLKARSDEPPVRRRSFSERSSTIKKNFFQGLRLKKQHSTGELEKRGTRGTSASIRSTASTASWMSTESSQSGMTGGSQHTDSNASFVAEDEPLDASVTETYMGEWKNDKRSGFGISERSDGLKYEGEWFNNKKYGYGVTTFKDGTKEEGKYKNNVLITSQKKKHLFLIRSAKFRERIEAAVSAAQRASKIALQKADIAISRTSTARAKAEQADLAAIHAREDADFAIAIAKQLAPDFTPSSETMRPPLAALSRLVPQLSVSAAAAAAAAAASGPAGQQPANKYGQTPNNIHGVDYSAGDTSASASSSPQPRIDDMLYEKSLSPDSATSTLNRRPSVAIGGVRGPTSKNEQEHLTSLSNTTYPLSNNRAQLSGYNGNQMMGNSVMERKNSLDQFGRKLSQSGHNMYQQPYHQQQPLQQQQPYQQQQQPYQQQQQPYQQQQQPYQQQQQPYQQQQQPYQQQQQPQQYQQGAGYRQQSFDGGMYPSSGDEMRDAGLAHGQLERGRSSLRRGPVIRQMSGTSPGWSGGGGQGPGPGYAQDPTSPSYSFQQAMNDHFDHYKRPPSRDRSRDPSMDRFSRSSRQSSVAHLGRHDSSLMGSRAPSRGPSPAPTPGSAGFRSSSRQRPSLISNSPTPSASRFYPDANDSFSTGSNSNTNSLQRRMATPLREMSTGPGNGSVASGFAGIGVGGIGSQPGNAVEEMLLRQRLGQEIPHSGNTPKRTESLYLSPARKKETVAPAPVPKRKKSLPGSKDAPVPILSREEASVLSSQRREEMRRQAEEAERMRANPLLYFCSPQVKAWFARQQLTIFILIFNFSLAFLFFKLLT